MLELVVFLCGAVVMMLEMVGSRILAPFAGTSIVVWTSLIGVVLAALSCGAWFGGSVADRRPDRRVLGFIVLGAAGATALIAATKAYVLVGLSGGDFGGRFAVLVMTSLLFFPASFLLGMVTPFAVRLTNADAEHSGRSAGRVYAVSSAGSIVGVFLGGFVVIGFIGSTNSILLFAQILCLASMLCHVSTLKPAGLALCLLIAAQAGLAVVDRSLAAEGVHDLDTEYSRLLVRPIAIAGQDRPMRGLLTNPGAAQSAIFLDDPNELALAYTRFFKLHEHFRPGAERVLMLGGGAYSFPRYALDRDPKLFMDVVELDPGVTDVARRWFHLSDRPGLNILHEDGRMFLNRTARDEPGRYAVALVDVFSSDYSVPFHLAGVEATRLLHAALDEDGVVVMNILSAVDGRKGGLLRSILAAYTQVFARTELFQVFPGESRDSVQNLILVAFKKATALDFSSNDPEFSRMLGARVADQPELDLPPLTDDFAPVERRLGFSVER